MYDCCRFFRVLAIRCGLVLALAFGALTAHAAFPAPKIPMCSVTIGNGLTSDSFPTCQAAAQSMARYYSQPATVDCPFTATNGLHCRVNGFDVIVGINQTASCPTGSSLSDNQCTCTAPLVQNAANNGCVAPPDPMDQICKDVKVIHNSTLNAQGKHRTFPGNTLTSGFACDTNIAGAPEDRGCGIHIKVEYSGSGDGINWRTSAVVDYTGNACSATETGPSTPVEVTSTLPEIKPEPVGCPHPKIEGSANMNGATVKLCSDPILSMSPTETDVEKKNPGTPSEIVDTTQRNTVCDGTTCTTTTVITSTTSTGSSTTVTSSKSTGKALFCAANPTNGNCGGQGGGGGDGGCAAGAATAGCTPLGVPGDADVPTDEVDVGGFAPDNLAGFNFPAQSCPADLAFTAFGQDFKIEYKPICDAAPYVKPAVLLAAALAALMIVYGALTAKT